MLASQQTPATRGQQRKRKRRRGARGSAAGVSERHDGEHPVAVERLHDSPDDPLRRLALDGWFQSRMEFDKSLLTLASGGIALMVGLLSSVGANSTPAVAAYMTSIGAFTIVVGTTLAIFKRNSAYCQRYAAGDTDDDAILTWLDRTAVAFFGIGILAAIVAATTINTSRRGELAPTPAAMAKDRSTTPPTPSTDTRSLNGIANLAPKPATVPEPAAKPAESPRTPASPPPKPSK